MTSLDTFDKALLLRQILDALVYYHGPREPLARLSDPSYWVHSQKLLIYAVQTWIGDGVLIYRCYNIFEGRWYSIVLPGILFLSTLASGSLMIYFKGFVTPDLIVNPRFIPFASTFQVLTLIQNVLVTAAIVIRIWKFQKHGDPGSYSRVRRAAVILMESGAMYSCSIAVLLGTFLSRNVTSYGWVQVASSAIPITFNMIIIRVYQGLTIQPTIGGEKTPSTIDFRSRVTFHEVSRPRRPTFINISPVFEVRPPSVVLDISNNTMFTPPPVYSEAEGSALRCT